VSTSDAAAELGLHDPVARRVGTTAYQVGARGSEWAATLQLAQPVRRAPAASGSSPGVEADRHHIRVISKRGG
jgi:hypothetical protein